VKTYPMKCSIRLHEAAVTRVDVYDDIGPGFWDEGGLTDKLFAAQLADVRGPLDVHINSGGGDVGHGLAISNAIRGYRGFKRTIVDGIAASIASVIFQAGDDRVVEPGGMVMIHDPFTSAVGNAAEMRKLADDLDKHGENIAEQYARRAGGTPDQWRDVMRAQTWFKADEAVTAGLADRVGTGLAELPAGFDLALFDAVPGRIAAALRSMPSAAVVNADGNHAPMTGTHAHAHPAYGSQGGDQMHSHEHAHGGDGGPDASHSHGHAQDRGSRRLRGAGGPYEPEPYRRMPDETVCCPECGKFNDTDARFCDQCGTKLAGRDDVTGSSPDQAADALARETVRAIIRDELGIRNAMPGAVRSKFTADLKSQPPKEISAAIHRLAEWSASGHYPAGMTHADIQWMYGQCTAELKRRNPDSDAGGNLPAHDALAGRFMDCHFLVEATTAAAAAAKPGDLSEEEILAMFAGEIQLGAGKE
jgi:ATP-dependent protease ClpP protease subunit